MDDKVQEAEFPAKVTPDPANSNDSDALYTTPTIDAGGMNTSNSFELDESRVTGQSPVVEFL